MGAVLECAWHVLALLAAIVGAALGRVALALQRRLFGALVGSGRLPRHIAFIMDGNRRFALARSLSNKFDGHLHGFRRLEKILEWCGDLHIRTMTVFAFSVENFRRPQDEVETLMGLAMEKFKELSENSELVKKYNVRIRVLGELHLLPADVREAAESAMRLTAANSSFTLNICFPYTSQCEIAAAANVILAGLAEGALSQEDVNGALVNGLMLTRTVAAGGAAYAPDDAPLDLLIRTSGERRLSDFLTWQSVWSTPRTAAPMIAFSSAMWPTFSLLDLVPILLRYCRTRGGAQEEDACADDEEASLTATARAFLARHHCQGGGTALAGEGRSGSRADASAGERPLVAAAQMHTLPASLAAPRVVRRKEGHRCMVGVDRALAGKVPLLSSDQP